MTKVMINKHAKALYCYEYKGRYCNKCGLDSFENPWLMDFHHTNPEEKEYTISHKIRTAPFDKIKKELDKCILLCSHCHRKIHSEENLKEYNSNKEIILNKLNHIKNNDGVGTSKRGIYVKYEKSEIEKYVNNGKTINQISEILDETPGKVAAMLRKFKLETISGKRKWLDNIEDSIVRDYTKFGYTIEKIMKRRNISEEEVKDILSKNNISIRPPHPNQKIIDVDKLKELLNKKTSKVKIAKILECSENTIFRYCKKIKDGVL